MAHFGVSSIDSVQGEKNLKTRLTDEMVELSKKQFDAMATATYLNMSKAEANAFDARYERIKNNQSTTGALLRRIVGQQ